MKTIINIIILLALIFSVSCKVLRKTSNAPVENIGTVSENPATTKMPSSPKEARKNIGQRLKDLAEKKKSEGPDQENNDKKPTTQAEKTKNSGLNRGGSNNDENAAGNTKVTDENGTEIEPPKKQEDNKEREKERQNAPNLAKNEGAKDWNKPSKKEPETSLGDPAKNFECNKDSMGKKFAEQYKIADPVDDDINPDNSARFYCTDTSTKNTVILKSFFKGIPHNCQFYNLKDDKGFKDNSSDCNKNKIINNRLYGLAESAVVENGDYEQFKSTLKYNDVIFPVCIADNSKAGGNNNFMQIYTLPKGTRLQDKCIKNDEINRTNCCHPFLKDISRGILHGLQILNQGNSKFFLHSSIIPKNIYLELDKADSHAKVFIDNIKFTETIYDQKENKPGKIDMNQLGDTLLQLIVGSNENFLDGAIKSSFDLFTKIKTHIKTNSLDLTLKSNDLGTSLDIDAQNNKVVTTEEYLAKLDLSIFGFIYKLKNTDVDPNNQFQSVEEALTHEYIKKINNPKMRGSEQKGLEILRNSHGDY